MSDPFNEPAFNSAAAEEGESRFQQFRASLTSGRAVANEPMDEPEVNHQRQWSEEPMGASSTTSGTETEGKSATKERKGASNQDLASPEFVDNHNDEHPEDADCTKEAPSTSTGGWHFFKTKEEKELAALGEEESAARKTIKEEMKSAFAELTKGYKEGDSQVKAMLVEHKDSLRKVYDAEKAGRKVIGIEVKSQYDLLHKPWRKELESLRKAEKSKK